MGGGEKTDRGLFMEKIGQDIEDIVVAADKDQGIFNVLELPKEFHSHLFTCSDTLAAGRDGEETIGSDQAHDRTGPRADRSGDGFSTHQAEFDPDKIFNPDL